MILGAVQQGSSQDPYAPAGMLSWCVERVCALQIDFTCVPPRSTKLWDVEGFAAAGGPDMMCIMFDPGLCSVRLQPCSACAGAAPEVSYDGTVTSTRQGLLARVQLRNRFLGWWHFHCSVPMLGGCCSESAAHLLVPDRCWALGLPE